MPDRDQHRTRKVIQRIKCPRQRHQRTIAQLGRSHALDQISDTMADRRDGCEANQPFIEFNRTPQIENTPRYPASRAMRRANRDGQRRAVRRGTSQRFSECANSTPSSSIRRLPARRASSSRPEQSTVGAESSTRAKSQIWASVIQPCLEPWHAWNRIESAGPSTRTRRPRMSMSAVRFQTSSPAGANGK